MARKRGDYLQTAQNQPPAAHFWDRQCPFASDTIFPSVRNRTERRNELSKESITQPGDIEPLALRSIDVYPSIDIGVASEQNPAFRESQEDAVVTGHVTMELPGSGRIVVYIAVVCDGVGGCSGGEWASERATRLTVIRLLGRISAITDVAQIPEIVRATLESVNHELRAGPLALSGCATTLVAFIVYGSRWLGQMAAHVSLGDSRIYSVGRGGDVRQLTRDDSLVQPLVDAGDLDEVEALAHEQSGVITAALGAAGTLPEIAIEMFDIADCTAIISMTDRTYVPLIRSLRDGFGPFLADTVSRLAPTDAAEYLVAEAIRLGGTDNASAAVLQIGQPDHDHTTTGGER